MADLPITSLVEKTTPAVAWDKVVIIDSEDSNKVKIQEASQFEWPQWDTWATGPTGADGPTWATGADWTDGRTILSWASDPTTEWEDGDFYINTTSSTLFGPKSWTWGTWTSLVWATWSAWADGANWTDWVDGSDWVDWKTILNGTSNPTTQWVDGDFYINTTSNTLFWPKSWTWGSGTSLVWPTGATWATGADGADWSDWSDWADGLSVNWQGTYSGATAYVINDAVAYNWSSYLCILGTTWNLPTNATYWAVLAQKWLDGAGAWDMLEATYDPDAIQWDTFDMDNMKESATKKIMTATERSNIASAEQTANKWNANWYASLDWSWKIPEAQLPSIAISDFLGDFTDTTTALADAWVQASQKWDWFTVQTNGWETYIVTTSSPTTTGDITQTKTPTDVVSSVVWLTGVILKSALLSALNVEDGATADQSDSEIETAYNNQVWQVSGAEKTAWTETAVRRFSPADVKWMIDTHGGSGWWGGWVETVKIAGIIEKNTEFFEYIADGAKTVWKITVALQVRPAWQSFVVTTYKNWTSTDTFTITTSATVSNWRYKVTTDIAESLADWDVFTAKVTQVWTTTKWAELSFVANIS